MTTATKRAMKHPNILLIAVDSLLADRMSCYGFRHQTTPHIDAFARSATLFEQTYSPHIPTTSAYASMLTGRDCFGTEVVALRHQGGLTPRVRTLAEICSEAGYNTTCVGFQGNPASRGFDRYLDYEAWGSWETGRLPKAQNLNAVAQPEIDRLTAESRKTGRPWFMLLRHMDPHSPYLPPEPFDRLWHHGDERDPANRSLQRCMDFKPFRDYFATWFPPGCTDAAYIVAQYDGAVSYMDACIQRLFTQLDALGIADQTIVVLNGDHGETLDDHECWFDHHGLYDVTLHVPLIIRYPGKTPAGRRVAGYNQHKDLVPTLLELADIQTDVRFDGRSLMQLVRGEAASFESEFYLTECTWMRKHGWRTPQWKLIVALEPDFHFMPAVELYNLVEDPHEDRNVAEENPQVVAMLRARMEAWIALREKQTGVANPMLRQGDWHGHKGLGAFRSSQQAYDTLHLGDPRAAAKLQAKAAGSMASTPNAAATIQPCPGDAAVFATVIGRGHSGTRAISHTLSQSGVYMGDTLNKSGDLVPPDDMYEACRVMARHVRHLGGARWDFSRLHTMPIDPAFTRLIQRYLASVLDSPARRKGWKIPETTLAFPWIVRLFPDLHYIYWVRDPRDAILAAHATDDLSDFGIAYEPTDDPYLRRAISWKYQTELVKATPKPARWLTVRFEDFVLRQDQTLAAVSDFLGIPLVKIPVRPESVGRWKTADGKVDLPLFREELVEFGYIEPKRPRPRTKESRHDPQSVRDVRPRRKRI